MFKELLRREDIINFITDLYNKDVYHNKVNADQYDLIGIFYDALFKYSIIVDNIMYFDSYFGELKYLFKKLDKMDDINDGINKLLSKIVITKLGYNSKESFIKYIYDKYIVNGYMMHAYSDIYTDEINKNGFIIDNYKNLYNDFNSLKVDLLNENINIIDKDFNDKVIYLTDNMKTAYYYSVRSPYYFYDLICNDDLVKYKDKYLKKNYKRCLTNIKKVISSNYISTDLGNKIIDLFNKEWELLNNDSVNSSIMLIRRDKLKMDKFDLDRFTQKYKSENYDIIFDRLVNNNYTNYKYEYDIKNDDIEIISFSNNFVKSTNYKIEDNEFSLYDDFVGNHGIVSLLMLLGVILLTVGLLLVIINII